MKTALVGPQLPGMHHIAHIGSGGFADVFLYQREEINLKVAVKLLRADALSPAERTQFQDEADAMAYLADHPSIVTVYGAGISPDNRPYLIMKYYAGSNLEVQVAHQRLTVPDSLRVGISLAGAVETAHRAGIIHRDIKPANILRDHYGQPALTDFGIAGRTDRDPGDDRFGLSVPWSPPEILSGHSGGSAASDIYSLAATIWHLLVGRMPFAVPGGDNTERAMFARILHAPRPPTGRPDAPWSLDKLLQRAMAKDPSHRPATAEEFGRQLQRVENELRLDRTEIPLPPSHSHGTGRFLGRRNHAAVPAWSSVAPPDSEPTALGPRMAPRPITAGSFGRAATNSHHGEPGGADEASAASCHPTNARGAVAVQVVTSREARHEPPAQAVAARESIVVPDLLDQVLGHTSGSGWVFQDSSSTQRRSWREGVW